MLNLNNITLLCMSSVSIDLSIKALLRSSEKINFGDIKFVSHEKPLNLDNKIKFCYIDKINSLDDYSYKMIYQLDKYVDTDYVLVIQSDGYVINPHLWQDNFLNYDYIGAPFPLPRDDFSYRDSNNKLFRVGNGGFSLRSKKLIQLANKLQLEWKSFHGFYNEDGFICGMYKEIYENNGMKFAPIDVAKYFSHEIQVPEIQGITPFGFHGKFSKYYNK
jgi:hypothetical protein